ncbi:PREDICTED: potassium channel subfamily K member 18 [Crocodylus porosus]|uniref:potassium channel subfamily K member 18 n=1 Tax=Crocodylus porosus TaxID=8502 RepID=UPI000939310F|nr:PREDICTED: potassium channel subfamily K member 18 [Crocodylus porosus]
MERTSPPRQNKRSCTRLFWAVFPHACFLSSLVIYALLGAVMFSHIEGNRKITESKEYEDFMHSLWNISQNLSAYAENWSEVKELFKNKTVPLLKDARSEWFANPKEQWSFLGSLFFCCTVFTTVGYGHTYPITKLGKYLCMLYAFFGIPLMFLVLTDMGDILATILSKSYNEFRKLQSKILTCKLCCKKNRDTKDGMSLLMKHRIVIHEPLSITEVLKSQSSVIKKSQQCRNAEIFEMLIARENQYLAPPVNKKLERWSSCPELDRRKMMSHVIDNFDKIGKELEKLDVPIILMALIVFAYISCAAAILPNWEKMNFEEAFYFCFITLTTIGFGDIHLQHPNFFLFFSLYIVIGMETVIIAFKLGQDRLISFYKNLISYFGQKKAPRYKQAPFTKQVLQQPLTHSLAIALK